VFIIQLSEARVIVTQQAKSLALQANSHVKRFNMSVGIDQSKA
jgi:hypothetical protein